MVESTVSPGTMDTFIRPIVKEKGYVTGRDIHLVHAPERILPGNIDVYKRQVVTHGFQTILEENGIPKGKIRVITNGVDVSVTEKKDTGEFIVSYFGTLGISQNLRQLFPYFDVISSCVPRSKLLLICLLYTSTDATAYTGIHMYHRV